MPAVDQDNDGRKRGRSALGRRRQRPSPGRARHDTGSHAHRAWRPHKSHGPRARQCCVAPCSWRSLNDAVLLLDAQDRDFVRTGHSTRGATNASDAAGLDSHHQQSSNQQQRRRSRGCREWQQSGSFSLVTLLLFVPVSPRARREVTHSKYYYHHRRFSFRPAGAAFSFASVARTRRSQEVQ